MYLELVYNALVSRLLNVFQKKSFLFSAIAVIFLLRITYALTRDIFNSGPDAPNYGASPLDFAKYGFFSSEIAGGSFYPQGYPVLLWLFAEIDADLWIAMSQVFQVTLSVATVYVLFRAFLIFFEEKKAVSLSLLVLLYPAFTPMSGQAMYETVFIFFFYSHLLFALRIAVKDLDRRFLLLSGLLGGYTCVIHPRAIPWMLIIQLILFRKTGFRKLALYFTSFLSVVSLFMYRNKVAEDIWTLSSASELFRSWLSEKGAASIFTDGFWYGIHFWSPLSGEAKRGTWFHNFTLYHWIKDLSDSSSVVLAIATILSISSIVAWLLGVRILFSTIPNLALIAFLIPSFAFITDVFTYGDSRHRLPVVPLLILAQYSFFEQKFAQARANIRS